MNRDLHHMRQDYIQDFLTEENVARDPFQQFDAWFKAANAAEGVVEPNAMAIATADAAGKPAVRMVLMKSYSRDGIIWYTNYGSRKAQQIAENSHVALLFYWEALERQVRIEGTISKVPAAVSDEYFSARPYGSQIGAIASPQSNIISRDELEQRVDELQAQYKETDKVPRPDTWGGYIVKPDYFEFWQGRSSRLHDRLAFNLQADGEWVLNRLAP